MGAPSAPTGDPELGGREQPARVFAAILGDGRFLVIKHHVFSRSAPMIHLDRLLAQIASVVLDFLRGRQPSKAALAADLPVYVVDLLQ